MFVEQILPRAGNRLAVIESGAPISGAVDLLAKPHTDLLVVCDSGITVGVVTKSDIVVQISRCSLGSGLEERIDTIMTREVISCGTADPLAHVWILMKVRGLRSIPVLDPAGKPLGVLHVDDPLQHLLKEAETEDRLLRDYISGVGYR
jgi:CBS domain-containing protein